MQITADLLARIETVGQLNEYIHNLPENSQPRFSSTVSLKRTYGVTGIVWDMNTDCVVILPYHVKSSHYQKKHIDVRERPENTVIRCVMKEAGLDVLEEPKLLGIVQKLNTNKDLSEEFFQNNVFLITKFQGILRKPDEVLSEKNGSPCWIKRSLLSFVFEKEVLIDGELKKHPQYKSYKLFKDYAESLFW